MSPQTASRLNQNNTLEHDHETIHMCDFQRSFYIWRIDTREREPSTVTHTPPFRVNQVRVPLECRCELIDLTTGRTTEYGLGAACKTERVNVDRDIWTQPNANFHPIGSNTDYLRIKHWDHCDREVHLHPRPRGVQPKRQFGQAADAYALHRIEVVHQEMRRLNTNDDVIHAVIEGRPIVARTELTTRQRYRVVLDYPIKTINISDIDGFYQVDTGPVLLPDLDDAYESPIEGFRLAYIAHNNPEWAEVLINVPTLTESSVRVDHYAAPMRLETCNTMFEAL